MYWKLVAVSGLSMLCLLLLTACVGTGPDDLITDFGPAKSDQTPAEKSSDDVPLAVPDGFDDVHTGIAIRWVPQPECVSGKCQQIELFALKRCASKVYVEANVLDLQKRVVGVTRRLLGGLPQGSTALVTLDVAEASGASLDLVEVDCL